MSALLHRRKLSPPGSLCSGVPPSPLVAGRCLEQPQQPDPDADANQFRQCCW